MQNLVRSKTIGVTGNGGRGTAGDGPGRDLLYFLPCALVSCIQPNYVIFAQKLLVLGFCK